MTEHVVPGASMSCQELVELVTDYLEGALDERTTTEVEAHLAFCDGCVDYLEQMRETIRALGQLPVDSLSERIQANLLASFREFHLPRR